MFADLFFYFSFVNNKSTKCKVDCSSQVVVCSFFRAGGIEEFSTEALGKMAMVVRNLHFLDKSHRISFDIYLPDYKNNNLLSILLITEVTILSLLTRVIAWFSNHG